jgi:hypothetical protein
MKRLNSYNRFIIVALLIYSALQIYCIHQLSINQDEGLFAAYGTSVLKGERNKDVKLFDSKLPITALNMMPRAVEQAIHPQLKRSWPESTIDIIRGRYVSLLVSILLGLLIFKWASELFDRRSAIVVFLLYLICPNFLAHGIFVSSDIYACLFITAAFYYLWKFCNTGQFRSFLWMSVAVALGQISKFSLFHLFILVPLTFIIFYFCNRQEDNRRFNLSKTAGYILLFLFVNWIIISASHLFFQVFLPIKEYSFRTDAFRSLQQFIAAVAPGFPVPLPSSYINSMDAAMYFDSLGGGEPGSLNGPSFILGKSARDGFWYYYFVVILFKVPIATLLIWIGSLGLSLKNYSRSRFTRNDLFLLLPVVYFLVYMNFFYKTQLGIRHIMVIFPFLFLLAAYLVKWLFETNRKLILYALMIYAFVSVFSYFPHFLPYTNEFLWNKKLVYRKISDTNITYGEGKKFLDNWMKKNPGAVFQPDSPVTGKVVIDGGYLNNLHIQAMHKFDWIRSLEPVDHIHSQYLVFDVSQNSLIL